MVWLLAFSNEYPLPGLENVAIFWFWLLALAGLVLINTNVRKQFTEKLSASPYLIPIHLNVAQSITGVIVMTYYGYTILAIVTAVVHIIIYEIHKTINLKEST
jgi:hypothetical protein